MMDVCPRCGDAATGRFCAGCGAPQRDVPCTSCGRTLVAGARYCNDCGSAASAASGATADRRNSAASLVKIVSVAAVLTFVAFVAGQIIGRRSVPPTDAGVARAGSPRLAMTDISNMSPEERASRLFKRVMRYSEQRKMDSARFFAPMAI